MKFKNPRSIADLNINWTFINPKDKSSEEIKSLFRTLNPNLSLIKMINDQYIFKFENRECYATTNSNDLLWEYMEYVNWSFWNSFRREVVLSHFERISENEFIIHEKK